MKTLIKIGKSTLFRLLFGGVIVAIVIGGSLNDFYEFSLKILSLKFGVILLASLFLVGLLYYYLNNPSYRLARIGVIPDLEKVIEDQEFKVTTLSHFNETVAISKLASEAFKEYAMPPELIQELHWFSRKTVYILKHSKEGIIGYLALFFPNYELKVNIFEGKSDPLEWKSTDLIGDESVWKIGYIYLESTVVSTPNQTERFCMLLRYVLNDIEKNLKSNCSNRSKIEIFGLAANQQGENLMRKTLNLKSIMFANERKDEMGLFSGFKTISDISDLKRKIENYANCLMLRRSSL